MTTLSASQLAYTCAWPLPAHAEGRCYLCGGPAFAPVPLKQTLKVTFTGYPVARGDASAGICRACAWFLWDTNTDLQAMLGRDKPQRPRNYSHFVRAGDWQIFSKGQKREMADLLLGDSLPEVALIAVSGQKHLAFRARVNPPGQRAGWVQYEEQALWLDLDFFAATFADVTALYQARFNKDSILSGRYRFYPDSNLSLWKSVEPRLKPLRGGLLLDLCVYLATRKEGDDSGE